MAEPNERLALELAADSKRLRARILETVSLMTPRYARLFAPSVRHWAIKERRLYGASGFYLQWQLRSDPNAPESYENQQCSVEIVVLGRVREIEQPR